MRTPPSLWKCDCDVTFRIQDCRIKSKNRMQGPKPARNARDLINLLYLRLLGQLHALRQLQQLRMRAATARAWAPKERGRHSKDLDDVAAAAACASIGERSLSNLKPVTFEFPIIATVTARAQVVGVALN